VLTSQNVPQASHIRVGQLEELHQHAHTLSVDLWLPSQAAPPWRFLQQRAAHPAEANATVPPTATVHRLHHILPAAAFAGNLLAADKMSVLGHHLTPDLLPLNSIGALSPFPARMQREEKRSRCARIEYQMRPRI
jgi:hypothetical protein